MPKLHAFGTCDCGKWGHVPPGFDERKHFLRCDCKKTMKLLRSSHSPTEFALRKEDEIIPGTFKHGEKL